MFPDYTEVRTVDGYYMQSFGQEFAIHGKVADEIRGNAQKFYERIVQVLGRQPTRKELREGIPRPDSRDDYQRQEQQRRFRLELNPPPIDTRTHAERVRDERAAIVKQREREAMPTDKRLLLEADERVAAEKKIADDDATAAAIRATAAYPQVKGWSLL